MVRAFSYRPKVLPAHNKGRGRDRIHSESPPNSNTICAMNQLVRWVDVALSNAAMLYTQA